MANILNWFDPQLTKNFHVREFSCHDGTAVPWDMLGNVQTLAENLQVLRDDVKKALIVVSGFRNATYNEDVGGENGSFHIKASAADLKCPGLTPKQLHARILKLIKEGKMQNGGLGLYPTFVHYDIGPANRRW